MVGVTAFCVAVVVAALLVPQGHVVTLNVLDREGHSHPTQLWIVEIDGVSYLRAGAPDTRWLARLRERPEVTLDGSRLGDDPTSYCATPIDDDPVARALVGEAMGAKYGWADSFWGWISDRTRSIPIRLGPPVDQCRAESSS